MRSLQIVVLRASKEFLVATTRLLLTADCWLLIAKVTMNNIIQFVSYKQLTTAKPANGG